MTTNCLTDRQNYTYTFLQKKILLNFQYSKEVYSPNMQKSKQLQYFTRKAKGSLL